MVQETLIALSRALPFYRYVPDETGHFRNYLTGILRHKALKRSQKDERNRALEAGLLELCAPAAMNNNDDTAWRESLFEIAMHLLLADKRIADKSKQIFQRLVVDGLSPEDVAAAYGTDRNNIDKTKSRMMARLREIVRDLETAGDV